MAAPGTSPLLAGRYRVERLLGSGGMAAVCLAEDVRLERRVAVKRLHAHSSEDAARALMRQGRFREAVPVLRRAVSAFPAGTGDLNYAYALYNLGRSLRLSGRPAEAIPILERRLRIPNQTATVRQELEAARRATGRG